MKTNLLFDTNIIIDYLNGMSYAKKWIDGCVGRAISVISVIEVLCGVPVEQEPVIHHWLYQSFTVLNLDDDIVLGAVNVRRTKKLKLPDTLILSTAITHHLTLCTRDAKDFSVYQNVKVMVPK